MVRSVYSRFSMSPRTDDEPEMSRKEKNRLAAARFRNKQKSEIQLFRELCENQTNEIATLKNRLKIATEKCGELSRLLDIAVTYYGEPPELKGRMPSRTPVVSIANHQKPLDFSQSYSGCSSTSSSEWSPNYSESTPSTVSSPDLDFAYFNPEMASCRSTPTTMSSYSPGPTAANQQYYAESDSFYRPVQSVRSASEEPNNAPERPSQAIIDESQQAGNSQMPAYQQTEPIGNMAATSIEFRQISNDFSPLFKKYFG